MHELARRAADTRSVAAFTFVALAGSTEAAAVRPFVTDDARIIDRGQFETENWLDLHRARRRWHRSFNVMAGLSFSDWGELIAGGAVTLDGDRQIGIANPVIQPKFLLVRAEDDGVPGLSLAAGVTLPVGIGPVYADEILHASGLRPDREVSSMSTQEIRRFFRAVVETLHEAAVRAENRLAVTSARIADDHGFTAAQVKPRRCGFEGHPLGEAQHVYQCLLLRGVVPEARPPQRGAQRGVPDQTSAFRYTFASRPYAAHLLLNRA